MPKHKKVLSFWQRKWTEFFGTWFLMIALGCDNCRIDDCRIDDCKNWKVAARCLGAPELVKDRCLGASSFYAHAMGHQILDASHGALSFMYRLHENIFLEGARDAAPTETSGVFGARSLPLSSRYFQRRGPWRNPHCEQ